MRKKINDLFVATEGSEIIIGQPSVMSEDQRVIITPEQVDVLISWLKEAKEEAVKGSQELKA